TGGSKKISSASSDELVERALLLLLVMSSPIPARPSGLPAPSLSLRGLSSKLTPGAMLPALKQLLSELLLAGAGQPMTSPGPQRPASKSSSDRPGYTASNAARSS